MITHLLTYAATTFSGQHLMPRNAKAWKLKRAVLQNEEHCQANTLLKRHVPKGSSFLYLIKLKLPKNDTSHEKHLFDIMVSGHLATRKFRHQPTRHQAKSPRQQRDRVLLCLVVLYIKHSHCSCFVEPFKSLFVPRQ